MGKTALYDDSAVEITRLKAHRAIVLTQIDRVIQGGQAFGGGGVVSVTQVSLADLRKDLAATEQAIIRITNGSSGFTVWPDFGGDTSTRSENTL
jgi:hypothetical protein